MGDKSNKELLTSWWETVCWPPPIPPPHTHTLLFAFMRLWVASTPSTIYGLGFCMVGIGPPSLTHSGLFRGKKQIEKGKGGLAPKFAHRFLQANHPPTPNNPHSNTQPPERRTNSSHFSPCPGDLWRRNRAGSLLLVGAFSIVPLFVSVVGV